MLKLISLVLTKREVEQGQRHYNQEEYIEAETLFQQAVDVREKTLGGGHKDTLNIKHWLGLSLYRQENYSKAEAFFQQAVYGREKTFGGEHKATLASKYWLGFSLYRQENYSKAEAFFQQAVDGQEKTLGGEHKDTLDSKHWLGLSLFKQENYSRAEALFQQVVDGHEKTLGREHEGTFLGKNWLGLSLFKQENYSKAEALFQQTVDGQEKTLAGEYEAKFDSKYWLQLSISEQKKNNGAGTLLPSFTIGREEPLGEDDTSTLQTAGLIQELHLESSLPAPIEKDTQQGAVDRLSNFFPQGGRSHKSYTDSDISQISSLLKQVHVQWSQSPRTYIVLRTINQLSVFNDLVHVGFSDYWLPATERSLPQCLRGSVRTSFVNTQHLVLTKSTGVEKGEHYHFQQGELPPFDSRGVLGNGGSAQVDRVLSTISFKEYARKRVLRSTAFGGRKKEHMIQFIAEIQILKRLQHRHIVQLVGSYTDSKYISLMMLPAAEMDLGVYLSIASVFKHPELRTFFGCLATALEFLHVQKVRHKDIKPGNILIDRGNVLLADFGLSLDFEDANESITTGTVNGRTAKYCAPEVAHLEPRNTRSDIWSLGVVFMEMIVVLKGKSVQDMDKFFEQHGSREKFIRTNIKALPEFIEVLKSSGKPSDNKVLDWTQQMLSMEQELRPSATSLVASITTMGHQDEGVGFCGICCVPCEEDFSDCGDE